jgi:hypothetical protein
MTIGRYIRTGALSCLFIGVLSCEQAPEENSSVRSEANRSDPERQGDACVYSTDVDPPQRFDGQDLGSLSDCGTGDYHLPEGVCSGESPCSTGHYRECIWETDAGTPVTFSETPYDAWVCDCDGTWACWLWSTAGSGCAEGVGLKNPKVLGGANCSEYEDLLPADIDGG